MSDARTESLLQDVVRRLSRSLLQYTSESFPWTMPGEQDAVQALRDLAAEEQAATARIMSFLRRRHLRPSVPVSYPSSFTTTNYVALDYLLPRLAEDERQSLTAVERHRDALEDADARAELERVAEMMRRHLKALEALAPAHPAAAAR